MFHLVQILVFDLPVNLLNFSLHYPSVPPQTGNGSGPKAARDRCAVVCKQSCSQVLHSPAHCPLRGTWQNWTRTTATRASLKLILRGWGTVLASIKVLQPTHLKRPLSMDLCGPGTPCGAPCTLAKKCYLTQMASSLQPKMSNKLGDATPKVNLT